MTNLTFKESVETYLKAKDMKALKLLLDETDEMAILHEFTDLSTEDGLILYRLLSKEKALFIFEQLDTFYQQNLLKSFTEETANEMFLELSPDDRVRLLDELPAKVVKKLMASLSAEEREVTNLLMGYEAQTAGRIMIPDYVRLEKQMTVDEALQVVRDNAEDTESLYTLYVTDDRLILLGVLSLRELLMAKSQERIGDIMQENVLNVSTSTDQEEVARMLQNLNLLAIPVVDKEQRLMGVIAVDEALDILEDEATEDMFDSAGISDIRRKENNRSEALVFGSMWKIWKMRLPFLVFSLLGGILAGMVIEGFEETLNSVAVVAVFIPIIMDMGGNVGTQSSTVFTRGLLLGHIKLDNMFKIIMKEILVGISMGCIVGGITGLIAYFWFGFAGLGLAVGLALIFTITIAAALGFLVPYLLVKLGIDQAAGTGPILTSIKDITGLVVYFYLVTFFLSHLL